MVIIYKLPDLSGEQVNLILRALGQRPYIEVADLIGMLSKSVQEQQTMVDAMLNPKPQKPARKSAKAENLDHKTNGAAAPAPA